MARPGITLPSSGLCPSRPSGPRPTQGSGAEFVYKCTDYYHPESEQSLLWNDAALAIDWPLTGEPQLSAKDMAGKPLNQAVLFD